MTRALASSGSSTLGLVGREAEVALLIESIGGGRASGTIPVTSAYAITQALRLEAGLDHPWREARAFYGLLAFFVVAAALFVFIPGLPLIQVVFLSQVLDGSLLPVILTFVFLLAGSRDELRALGCCAALLTAGP